MAAAIADRFERDGIPWITSLRDPVKLISAIRDSGIRREMLPPATLVVLGRTQEAVTALDSELAVLERTEERSAPGWPSGTRFIGSSVTR